MRKKRRCMWSASWLLSWCPLVAGGAGFRGFRTCQSWLWSSDRALPAFCPPCRSALGAFPLNMPLFRVLRAFLARFGGFVWVCLAWRFAWLVGLLYACGVRRIKDLLRVCLYFSSSLPSFMLFALPFVLSIPVVLLPCLCSLCGLFLGFFCLGCCFLFPFGLCAKRKGAKCFPCVLSCPVVGLL